MNERMPPYSKLTNAPGGPARGYYAKSPAEQVPLAPAAPGQPPQLLALLTMLRRLPRPVLLRLLPVLLAAQRRMQPAGPPRPAPR